MKLLALTHSLSDIDGVGVYGSEVLRRVADRFDGVKVLIAQRVGAGRRDQTAPLIGAGLVLATGMAARALHGDQATLLALSAESWVTDLLSDRQDNRDTDHLDEQMYRQLRR